MNKAEYETTLKQLEAINEVVTSTSTLSERARTELDVLSKDIEEKVTEYEAKHRVKNRKVCNVVRTTRSIGFYVYTSIIVLIVTLSILFTGASIATLTSTLVSVLTYEEPGVDYDDYLSQLEDLYSTEEAEE